MTNQEAIEKLQRWITTTDEMLQRWNNAAAAEELREYAEIYKLAIAALEKQKRVKPCAILNKYSGELEYRCSICGAPARRGSDKYCSYCGQAFMDGERWVE